MVTLQCHGCTNKYINRLPVKKNTYQAILSVALFLSLSFTAAAKINIGLEQLTYNGAPNHLNVFYTATSAYSSPPFNFWNSQLFTLRWSTSLGSEVIQSIENTAAFSFTQDGAAQDGGDGFYYQKFTSSTVSVVQAIGLGARLDVLRIEVSHPSIATGDFELITVPNSWVIANFGTASVNAAVGGEQFLGFAPAEVIGVALPVELISFKAEAREKDILVRWDTALEEGADHFVVERSVASGAAADFRAVGQVLAQQRPSTYEWPDPEVQTGFWYYYRLKQVDQDGTFTYSPIRSARINGTGGAKDFFLYPNPVAERLTVHCTSGRAQKAALIIRNMEGRMLRQRPIDLIAGQNQIPISVQELPPGVYELQLVADTQKPLRSARFIKINRR